MRGGIPAITLPAGEQGSFTFEERDLNKWRSS